MLVARPKAMDSCCPCCSRRTSRVHSHYMRRLTDLPWQGRVVEIRLHARRFRCANSQCPRRIFTERLLRRFNRKPGARFGSAKARWRSALRWVASRVRACRTGSPCR
ncbi:MAG: transposase [Mesorhizobium sp.]|nr:transposase [Mesorhizobium sp. M5C.F.Ca.IN.020.14.1.1]RWI36152.1 MAG: transposase [Mesorhizobium sp.]RWI63579.1 MAG: transposase [Mesorhizobium sp.]RWJ22846.1 MAG: transposase [Mesorhizobium sp.]TIQ70090.1 MAG: transposase [Mesorhizobium sp.]